MNILVVITYTILENKKLKNPGGNDMSKKYVELCKDEIQRETEKAF